MIASTNRGGKHACSSCFTKFYDMNKLPAACPNCKLLVPVIAASVPRRRRTTNKDNYLKKSPAPDSVVVVTDLSPKSVKWK